MNRLETTRIVFARIPDLNAAHSGHDAENEKDAGWGPIGNRLINQPLSFKLLAGGTILLMAVAILQSAFPKKSQPTDPSATASASPETRPQTLTASSDGVSPWRPTTAQAAQKQPTLLRPAPAEGSQAPVAVIPPPPEYQEKPIPRAIEEAPSISVWPNPVHPASEQAVIGAEQPRGNANEPMSIRPPEYQADVRAGSRPTEAGAAPNGIAP